MANSSRVTSGSFPRLLQEGIDKMIQHFNRDNMGAGSMIFADEKTDKAIYTVVQLAGPGLASVKSEGSSVAMASMDQDWVWTVNPVTVAIGARFTKEALEDNLYEDLIPRFAQRQSKVLAVTKDTYQAALMSGVFSDSASRPDGVNSASASHPLQAGGTSDNLGSSVSLSETALENIVIKAQKLKNPDGLYGSYAPRDLIVPVALGFTADKLVNSRYKVDSADNTINSVVNQGYIKRVIPWVRLDDSSTTAYYLTTDADDGFKCITRKGIEVDSSKEPMTFDTIVMASERYINMLQDFRAVIASQGA